MKKKLLVIPVLVMILSMMLAVTGWACGCGCDPCPPPPTCKADCSPGFWKNHTELWAGDYSDPEATFMLAALRAKGNDEVYRPYREVVTQELNAAYPNAPCDD